MIDMTQRRGNKTPEDEPRPDAFCARTTEADTRLLLTIPEVAQRLSLGRSFVYQLVMRGEIASIKIGRARRIPVNALEQFIAAQMDEDFDSNFDSNPGD